MQKDVLQAQIQISKCESPKQLLQRLLIALAQLKADNTS